MKRILFTALATIIALQSYSQCSFSGWVQYPSGTFTPPVGSFGVLTTCQYGGEYSLHNVVAGNVYEWSLCSSDGGSAFWDMEMTLYNNGSQQLLAYNDDFCSYNPKITWTANFTGVVRLIVTEYGCWSNIDCSQVMYRQVGPSCNYTNPGTWINENETCGGQANDGCNMLSPAYTPINCGDTYFGNSYYNGSTRDTDWYQFTVNQSTTVTATIQPEFAAELYFVNVNNCVGPSILAAVSAPSCQTSTLSYTFGPGTWVVFVAPPFAGTIVCGNLNEYSLSLDMGSTTANLTPIGPFCQNSPPAALTATPAGGTWSGPGVSGNQFNPALAGAGTHTLTYTKNAPCAATGTMQVVVNPSPSPVITPAGPFCNTGSSVNLSASPGGGTWSGTGITNPSAGTFDPATAQIGSNNITYSVTVAGCTGSTSANITVNQTPNTSITPAGPFCSNGNSTILIAATPGGTWSGPGITNPSAGAFDPATAGAGTHTISYTIGGSCPSTSTQQIVVNAAPNTSINPAGPFCSNGNSTILIAASPGGTWSGPGIINPSAGAFDPATAGVGTHTISYTIGGNCPSTSTQQIVVNAAPNASITPAGPYCLNEPATTLTAATPGGTWSGPGITNPSAGTFNPSTAGVGTHTINYSVTTNGCTSTSTTQIIINNNANTTITPAGPFCTNGNTATLTAATPGGTWSGPGITNPSAGTFDPAVAGPGNHTITYSISGSCGSSSTTQITVNAAPNATITPAGPFCIGDSPVTLISATPGGTWSGTGITNPSAGTFNPATAGVGIHTISYSVTTNGCTSSSTLNITVNQGVNTTITPAGPFCANGSSTTLTSVTPGGTWSGTGITNPSAGTFDPAQAGIGTHTITYSISGTCGSSSTTSIVVNAVPDASILSTGPFCTNQGIVTLQSSMPGGTWGGDASPNGTINTSTLNPGTINVTYTITQNGCTASSSTTLTILAPAVASFTHSVNGNSVQFTNQSTGASSYTWNFGDNSTSSQVNPSHVFAGNGPYDVMLIASNGCSSDTIIVRVTLGNTGIEEQNAILPYIFPNPASHTIQYNWQSQQYAPADAEIISITGQILKTQNFNQQNASGTVSIQLEGLPSAVYILRIRNHNTQWETRFIKY